MICVNCGDQIDKKYAEAENINRDYDYILNHLSATVLWVVSWQPFSCLMLLRFETHLCERREAHLYQRDDEAKRNWLYDAKLRFEEWHVDEL